MEPVVSFWGVWADAVGESQQGTSLSILFKWLWICKNCDQYTSSKWYGIFFRNLGLRIIGHYTFKSIQPIAAPIYVHIDILLQRQSKKYSNFVIIIVFFYSVQITLCIILRNYEVMTKIITLLVFVWFFGVGDILDLICE